MSLYFPPVFFFFINIPYILHFEILVIWDKLTINPKGFFICANINMNRATQ